MDTLDPTSAAASQSTGEPRLKSLGAGVWSSEEHARFLEATALYPCGPWKLVAAYVGSRSVRQTMTHAQKFRQKAARRLRGLRTKQARMRMHLGHRVSDESLVQERLRLLGVFQRGGRDRSPVASSVSSSVSSGVTVSALSASPSHAKTELDAALTLPLQISASLESLPAVESALDSPLDGLAFLDELATGPRPEDCADLLSDLLFWGFDLPA